MIAALAVGVIVSEFVGMPWPLIVGTIGCVGTAIAAVLVLKDQRIDSEICPVAKGRWTTISQATTHH